MSVGQTISADYLAQQQALHRSPHYGVMSLEFAPIIKDLMVAMKVRSVSDYGAGKENLRRGLNELGKADFEYFPYDPAFPDYGEPKPADLVCCIDVLEHIELPFLDAVLLDLRRITQNIGFYSIHTAPALKQLPDGRNAHLIQQPSSWWLPRLCQHFEIKHLESVPGGFWVVTKPRQQPAQ